jgi:hypothetical protein
MSRLMDLNLIETFRPWAGDGAGTGGRYPDLVHLTDQDRLACLLLTGLQPRENEYDLVDLQPGKRGEGDRVWLEASNRG